MKDFKPLLAFSGQPDLETLRYPVLASPKLDGIRCVKLNGKALTRKLEPVRNNYVRAWVEANLPDGIDGELLLRNMTAPFAEVSSAIMGHKGEPDFVFAAFDLLGDPDAPFEERFRILRMWGAVQRKGDHVQVVPHVIAESPGELREIVQAHLAAGYEGTMVRAPYGRYKFGRSGEKEGILLKIKQFEDAEGEVVGLIEEKHNANEATRDKTGRTKRSSAKEGKVGTGTTGALIVRFDGMLTKVGPGCMTDAQRAHLWDDAKSYFGPEVPGFPGSVSLKVAYLLNPVKFKFQPPPGGRKSGEAPRFPTFLGWRVD